VLQETVKVDVLPGESYFSYLLLNLLTANFRGGGCYDYVPASGDAPSSGKGNSGDLLVHVNVAASKIFWRQGANLHHEARIPVHAALLGGRIRVPTPDGHVDARVHSGTQHGEEMVLRNHGVSGRGKGGLFVSFVVQFPR